MVGKCFCTFIAFVYCFDGNSFGLFGCDEKFESLETEIQSEELAKLQTIFLHALTGSKAP